MYNYVYRPQDLQNGFLVRSREKSEDSVLSTKETNNSSELPENYNASEESTDQVMNDLVRIFVSYDMGWSKRGSGRQYDSLNGYAAIIGTQSGKVLDFATRNRQCRLCYLGRKRRKRMTVV